MNAAWQTNCLQRLARSSCLRCRSSTQSVVSRVNQNTPLTPRPFSSSSFCRREVTDAGEIIPAEEIDFSKLPQKSESAPKYARIVPASPSYFSAYPNHNDRLLALETLLRKYETLPLVSSADVPRIAWIKAPQYATLTGESINTNKWKKVLKVLQRLSTIHPGLMPKQVKDALNLYKRPGDPYNKQPNLPTVDVYGRALGVGRRKSSTARAWVVEGEGEVLINGKNLAVAFPRLHDRESVTWALSSTQRADKYNIWALVNGGGLTGQAEALTLAVAKALMVHEPALKPALRKAGCVTRDPRRVERKKPGHVKARKMPTWTKR
ncbi:MAG: 37S ribosomal protein S9, mitochondrial [Cirrosporium novae-zelandiae]|nr:MAG: 37S ribosomal protein S9, mitochondrial [Cirrosporium novae-zelandiae]